MKLICLFHAISGTIKNKTLKLNINFRLKCFKSLHEILVDTFCLILGVRLNSVTRNKSFFLQGITQMNYEQRILTS